jgi:hypothetical protein
MINYLFLVTCGSKFISEITVVRAKTYTEAREMLLSEFSDPSEYSIRLIESTQNLSFLN